MPSTTTKAGRRPRDLRKARGSRRWGSGTATPEQLEAKRAERRETSDARSAAALEEILGLFESGDLPSTVARVWIARAEGESPMVNWSLGNQLLVLLSGSVDARGFRQWQEVGRSVVKGAKATYILGPSTRKSTVGPDDALPGHDDGETHEVTRVVGFHPIPVFRIEDTDGAPVTAPDYTPPDPPPLSDVAARWGIPVVYGPNVGQSWLGLYSHAYATNAGRITLATHHESVFFHELAHAAHQRVLVAAGGDLRHESSARKELVAELCAAVLGRLHGLSLGDLAWSKAYLEQHCGRKSIASACMGVLNDAQACLRLILDDEGTGA